MKRTLFTISAVFLKRKEKMTNTNNIGSRQVETQEAKSLIHPYRNEYSGNWAVCKKRKNWNQMATKNLVASSSATLTGKSMRSKERITSGKISPHIFDIGINKKNLLSNWQRRMINQHIAKVCQPQLTWKRTCWSSWRHSINMALAQPCHFLNTPALHLRIMAYGTRTTWTT